MAQTMSLSDWQALKPVGLETPVAQYNAWEGDAPSASRASAAGGLSSIFPAQLELFYMTRPRSPPSLTTRRNSTYGWSGRGRSWFHLKMKESSDLMLVVYPKSLFSALISPDKVALI